MATISDYKLFIYRYGLSCLSIVIYEMHQLFIYLLVHTCSDKMRKLVSAQGLAEPYHRKLELHHPQILCHRPYQGFHQILLQQRLILVHSWLQQMFGVSHLSQQSAGTKLKGKKKENLKCKFSWYIFRRVVHHSFEFPTYSPCLLHEILTFFYYSFVIKVLPWHLTTRTPFEPNNWLHGLELVPNQCIV